MENSIQIETKNGIPIRLIIEGKSVINFEFDEEKEIHSYIIGDGMHMSDFYIYNGEHFPIDTYVDFITSNLKNKLFNRTGIKVNKDFLRISFGVKRELPSKIENEPFGKWHFFSYMKELQKQIQEIDHLVLINEFDYTLAGIWLTVGYCTDRKSSIEKAYKKGLALINQVIKQTEEILIGRKEFFEINMTVPNPFKIPLKQFFMFFQEYAKVAKGKVVELILSDTNTGISIKVVNTGDFSDTELQEWLKEYVEFTKFNDDKEDETLMKVNFEISRDPRTADIFFADFKNQISTLKNSVNIANLKSNILTNENEFLKKVLVNLTDPRAIKSLSYTSNSKLKTMISNNSIDVVFQELKFRLHDSSGLLNQLLILESNFNRVNKDFDNGKIDFEYRNNHLSRINSALLSLIDDINE